jgi:oligoendopeptidase F
VREAYPRLSHRYYALKARWFGRDALDHWDRNAPLPRWSSARFLGSRRAIPCSTPIALLAAHGGHRAPLLRGALDRRAGAPGQGAGAFAHPTVPSAHPYVLLNYQGKPRDVMTLAHELGHGVHQVLAAPNGALMAPTPLTLAETASVFGEMLTFRRLLEATSSPIERKAMLASKVEDMINTVVRQIAFYAFERKVHLERKNGELTAEKLGELWCRAGESLGPSIRLGPGYEAFWTYIPHFIHSPFYVYAYAFGDCMVNSLYGVYRTPTKGFVERYSRSSRPAARSIMPSSSPPSASTPATRLLADRAVDDRGADRGAGGVGRGNAAIGRRLRRVATGGSHGARKRSISTRPPARSACQKVQPLQAGRPWARAPILWTRADGGPQG